MARIVLNDNITLKGARRIMTKRGGSFRITKRNGRLYTFKKFKCIQPNTEAQMECRELLKRANELAKADMSKEGRREYWEKKAGEMGYKTAMGCARAWYIAELKGKELMKRKDEARDTAELKGMTRRKKNEEARELSRKDDTSDNALIYKNKETTDKEKDGIIIIGRRWKTARRKKPSVAHEHSKLT